MDKIPEHTFRCRFQHKAIMLWKDVTTDQMFKDKKIVIFGLPGAFTPTCSSKQLPQYEEKYDLFKTQGVDDIYCISVNDAFVMNAWGKDLGIEKVKLIPDGSGKFTRGMGMLVEKDDKGFGYRSWRYAAIINDGVVEKLYEEPGFKDNCTTDPFEVSNAENVLQNL